MSEIPSIGPGSTRAAERTARLAPSREERPASVSGADQDRASVARSEDRVELSAAARAASLRDLGPIRAERVAEIREQIRSGTYETPERLEAAVSRLLEELDAG